jgi:hypothetical protein
MADRDVDRMFTLPITADPATVARIMWPLETTGRLELLGVPRSMAARAVGPAVRATPMSLILLAEMIVRREPAAQTAVGRAVRVTPMSLTLPAEMIVRRELAAPRSMAARAVGRVVVATTSRPTQM